MCVVSMVFDHYQEPFKRWTLPDTVTPTPQTPVWYPQEEISELRRLILEFREAVEAARKVDVLTKQPDCEDPVKAALEQRVADLERRLNAMDAS